MLSLIGIIPIKDNLMKSDKINQQNKFNEFEIACNKSGFRFTNQRREIYNFLLNSVEHPSTEVIYDNLKDKIKGLSKDTIYRNLQVLEDLNLIFRVEPQTIKSHFDANLTPHAHFICTECGKIYDIFYENEIKIPFDFSSIGEVEKINIQVTGKCNKCKGEKIWN